MRPFLFVHLTHLKLSQVSLTYLKIFVYLEHLIKIHLLKSIFLRYFSLFSQKRYISIFLSKSHSIKWLLHMVSTQLYAILLLNSNAKIVNILLECLKKKQLKKKKKKLSMLQSVICIQLTEKTVTIKKHCFLEYS